MVENKLCIDRRSNVVFYPGIYIAFFESVEFPVFYVAEPRCKAVANQGEWREDMIAGATGIGKMLINFQNRFVIKESVENISRFAFRRADR